jgi:hypothetical protein
MTSVPRSVAFALAAWGLVGTAWGQESASAPKIVLSQDEWDFGQVWHQELPTFNLVIRNAGNAELRIARVKPTCGCTAAQPSRTVIPAGQSAELRVQVDTNGKQGSFTSEVHIHTNDPAREDAVLNIKGFIKRAVTRTPLGGLVIRTRDGRPGQTGKVQLKNEMAPEQMKVQVRSCSVAGVNIEVKEIAPALVYELVATTTAEMPLGSTEGTVMITTGLSREGNMAIPVAVRVVASVEAVPAAMLVNVDSEARPGPRTVSLQFYNSDQHRITGASCPRPDVKVTIGPLRPPGALAGMNPAPKVLQDAQVSMPPLSAIPKEGFVVTFETSDPETPQVELLVTIDNNAFQAALHSPRRRVPAKTHPGTAPAATAPAATAPAATRGSSTDEKR